MAAAGRGGGGGALDALLSLAAEEWRTTPFYRLALAGPDLDRIAQWGLDPRLGDAARGAEIAAGRWRIGAERLALTTPIPWSAPPPSAHFSAQLHGFSWLRDLAAAGAHDAIAALIQSWAHAFGEWHPQAWAPDLTAERLYTWFCWGRPAFEGGDLTLRPLALRSFARQVRHLVQAAGDVRSPPLRLRAGAVLTLAWAAGAPEGQRLLDHGLELAEEACAQQFLPDGLHHSRCPELTAEALADLITIDDALARRSVQTPQIIRASMAKIAAMLAYLRHGDGGLAAFHGGGEGDRATIARLLAEQDPSAKRYGVAPGAGYFRLEAGGAVLIVDTGASPPPAFGERAHAGALAFELSCGAERLIVNVGSSRALHPQWRAAGRATNGHSTLVVDDALSARFEAPPLGRGAARPIGPPAVFGRRADDEDGSRIEGRHEGYRETYGLVHARTLFMDTSGARIVGLDQAFRPSGGRSPPGAERPAFAVRFHLHPSVRVFTRGPRDVRLETPAGGHWRMQLGSGEFAIEESVYLARGGPPERTSQLVVHGLADPQVGSEHPSNRVLWTLTRIDTPMPTDA